MKRTAIIFSIITLLFMNQTFTQKITSDSFISKDGKTIAITFIKHASFYITYDGLTIYFDPVRYEGKDYQSFPKANVIFLTHDHYDHLDSNAIADIATANTAFFVNKTAYDVVKKGFVMKNGDSTSYKQIISIEAVPAYNTTDGRDIYHPKGRDNGYVLTIGGSRIYIPSDCEDMPEHKNLKAIDVAFLPINQPYTMTVLQAINAAKIIKPKILYPIHYSDTDLSGLTVLKDEGIVVKIPEM